MKLSVVTTLYRSSAFIRAFVARCSAAAQACADEYEIILVNDGSPDDSLAVAKAVCASDIHVRVVDLSRNFGHHKAIMAGLHEARGEWIFLINADLEEAPEALLDFWQVATQQTDVDVVYGTSLGHRQKGGLSSRFSGWAFYWILNHLSNERLDPTMAFCRLMSRRYTRALLSYKERDIFLALVWKVAGFTQVSVPIVATFKGSSTYTFRRKVNLAVEAITAFSHRPLVLIFQAGVAVSFLSVVIVIALIVAKGFGGFLAGWISVMLSIWLVGGMVMISLGIIGIYLAKIYVEIKARPLVIIRELVEGGTASTPGDARHRDPITIPSLLPSASASKDPS